jgi:hypothetical protein
LVEIRTGGFRQTMWNQKLTDSLSDSRHSRCGSGSLEAFEVSAIKIWRANFENYTKNLSKSVIN